MHSVKFDNVELVNATYNLQYARDHSAPEREFTVVPYATDDGSVIVFSRYNVKYIRVKGFISAITPAALQTAVDAFKEIFGRKDKNLDIKPQGGSTRRYVANCVRHTLTGDYYNNTFLPYEAEFLVVDGISKATALTSLLSASYSADTSGTFSLSVGSSPEQKLRFIFTFTTAAAVAGVKVRTYYDAAPDLYDTSIIVTRNPFADAEVLTIDTGEKTVKVGSTDMDYYGAFPRAILGSGKTKYEIEFTQILSETNPYVAADASTKNVYGNNWEAQCFMVKHTDATYRSLKVGIKKAGTPPHALTIIIEGDSDGKPDGSAIATFTIPSASVTTSYQALTAHNASNFTLTGNTKYWIVFKITGASDGDIASADSASDKIYAHSEFSSTILDSFSSPAGTPRGLTWDENNICSSDAYDDKIYKHQGFSAVILDSFSSPLTAPIGLAWDGDNIYSSDAASLKIYKHSAFSSTILSSFSSPSTTPVGLTHDETNIYSADQDSDKIYKHSAFSSIISDSFSSPSTLPTGLAFDGTNIYSEDATSDKIYKHSGFSSTISDSFSSPSTAPYGLAMFDWRGNASNKYEVYGDLTTNPYSKGNEAASDDVGVTWTDNFTNDLYFWLYFGGKASGAFSIGTVVNYYPRYL